MPLDPIFTSAWKGSRFTLSEEDKAKLDAWQKKPAQEQRIFRDEIEGQIANSVRVPHWQYIFAKRFRYVGIVVSNFNNRCRRGRALRGVACYRGYNTGTR